ncbi:ubiquitin carboxyl-terminal hydrolase 15-like protein [Sarcoptes scabiei]|uniref:Ubiquitin carboxyl-terminal hydrolase n=1 Tax=Sarcoptes scabiei TaxID=52283 RepID=A0A131ZVN6_SARSC|nr:ubiquitin carboxyl-terminal hydrolase 15-like protein [Sarcoptes scabiei]
MISLQIKRKEKQNQHFKQKQKHLVSIGVETPAVCGIQNHGNTCFINSIIQCLSNTTPLAEYYVMDYYLDDLARNNSIVHHKLSTCINGELTKCLSLLLKSLWSCMYSSDISLKFKRICSKYASQYLGHEQHDAQEFLLWVLDKSHEELRILDNVSNSSDDKMLFANGLESIKIPMEKSDERAAIEFLARCQKINSNSIIYDLFQSQLRSMIVCPNCGHSSKTFDPYMSLSLPVPIREKFTIFILVTFRENSTMVLYGLSIEAASTLRELKDEISRLVEIPQKRLLLLQFDNRLGMVEFSNNNETIQIQEILEDNESIHGLETPILSNAKNIDGSKEMCQQILTLVWLNRVGSVNSQNSIFGPFFTTIVSREVNYTELQTKILAEMSSYFIDGTDFECAKFSRAIPLRFEIVNTTDKNKKYIPNDVDHPLFVKQVESALIETEDSKNYNGPHHLKLIVEWDLDVRKSILVSDDKFDSIATKNRTFIDESVNLAKEHSKMDHYTLEDCLDMYFCDESLTLENAWMCPSCHSRQQSIKQLKIWSAPNILILHLKRSRYIPNLRHIKVNTLIKYPLNGLDLSKYIQKKNSVIPDIIDGEKISSPKSSIHRKNLKESSEENIYNLYAVCCHRGTIQEGHYTAMCKNSVDNCWYLYDDTKVMPLSEDLVVSSDACILFYQKSCIYDYHEKASTDEIDTVDGLRKIPINHWAFRMPPFSYYQTQAANANNNRSSTLPNRKSKNLGILTTSNMSNENSNLDHRERNHPMMQSSNPNYRALPHLNGPNSVKYNQNNYHQSRDANNRDEYNYYNNHQEYQNNPYYHDRQHDYHHSRANNVNHLQISQQMISTFPRNKSKYSY